ncbi:Strictosidine-O-beta-D-glucosidase [Durusdinium trenchii]
MIHMLDSADFTCRSSLSEDELESIIAKFGNDPEVKELVSKLAPSHKYHHHDSDDEAPDADDAEMDCDKVIAVHRFMLEEVEKFVEQFKAAPGVFYDFATARVVTGIAVLVKIEDRFHMRKVDLDRAVACWSDLLDTDPDFRLITQKLNEALSEFDAP